MDNNQTFRYKKFAVAVVSGKSLTDAAIDAGYSRKSAARQGSRLSKDAYVRSLISDSQDAVMKNLTMAASEVLEGLATIARNLEEATVNRIAAYRLIGSNHKLFTDRLEVDNVELAKMIRERGRPAHEA